MAAKFETSQFFHITLAPHPKSMKVIECRLLTGGGPQNTRLLFQRRGRKS